MKKHYVYEIVNSTGIIEYIGETINPKTRLERHKSNKNGKFYKRKDIKLNVVKEFDNKEEAWWYQCELQIKNGFETDREKNIKAAKRGAIVGGKKPQPVLAYSYHSGELIGEYPSQNAAERSYNLHRGIVSAIINGKQSHIKGYTFKLK